VEIDSIIETGIDEKILTSLHEINYLRQMLGQNISASAESQSQPSASAPAPDAAAASVPAPDVEGASAAALDERDGRISRVGHRKG
jgi:hypothetical protein